METTYGLGFVRKSFGKAYKSYGCRLHIYKAVKHTIEDRTCIYIVMLQHKRFAHSAETTRVRPAPPPCVCVAAFCVPPLCVTCVPVCA